MFVGGTHASGAEDTIPGASGKLIAAAGVPFQLSESRTQPEIPVDIAVARRTLRDVAILVAALPPNPRRRGTGEPISDGLPPSGVNPAKSR